MGTQCIQSGDTIHVQEAWCINYRISGLNKDAQMQLN